jgi:hypothetical protein
MGFEVTTKVKNLSLKGKRDPVIVVTMTMLPRGSGNRNKIRRLADAFKRDEILAPHIAKIVVGTTSLHLHLPPTFACWSAINERLAVARDAAAAEVPGQMTLPLTA